MEGVNIEMFTLKMSVNWVTTITSNIRVEKFNLLHMRRKIKTNAAVKRVFF